MNLHETSVHSGKLLVDNGHLTYFSTTGLIYVRDGDLTKSSIGPHFLDIGFAGTCKERCFFCHMQNRRVNHNLDLSVLKDMIERHHESLCQVAFGGAGNCLGEPNFYEAITVCEEAGIPWAVTESPSGLLAGIGHLMHRATVGISYQQWGDFKKALKALQEHNEQLTKHGDWDDQSKYVIHAVLDTPDVIKEVLPYVVTDDYRLEGLLLLAPKKPRRMIGDRELAKALDLVVSMHKLVPRLPIAMDECLMRFVPPDFFGLFGDVGAVGPCESARFTAYVHADGKFNFCSGNPMAFETWDALQAHLGDRACVCMEVDADHNPPVYDHPWPDVMVRRGPYTNSSSSCYFVIADPKTFLKLPIYPLDWRKTRDEFNWYAENKRLVELTIGEWAGTCAAQVAATALAERASFKSALDGLTRRILAGAKAYYLVADRGDGPDDGKTRFSPQDVSDQDIVLMDAGEEH